MFRSQDPCAAAVATPALVRKRSNVLEASCQVLLPSSVTCGCLTPPARRCDQAGVKQFTDFLSAGRFFNRSGDISIRSMLG